MYTHIHTCVYVSVLPVVHHLTEVICDIFISTWKCQVILSLYGLA